MCMWAQSILVIQSKHSQSFLILAHHLYGCHQYHANHVVSILVWFFFLQIIQIKNDHFAISIYLESHPRYDSSLSQNYKARNRKFGIEYGDNTSTEGNIGSDTINVSSC